MQETVALLGALDIDDEDAVPIVEAVEQVFGVTISDSEAETCETVGGLFALVCAKLPTIDRSDHLPCLTAATFRPIRRALLARCPDLDVRPDTRLVSFIKGHDHREWRTYLASETGLSIPQPVLRGFFVYVLGFATMAWCLIQFVGYGFASFFAVCLLGWLISKMVSRYGRWIWEDIVTVGDLARKTAALNVAQAVKKHGAVRKGEAWQALVTLLQGFSPRTGNIGPETRFFARRR